MVLSHLSLPFLLPLLVSPLSCTSRSPPSTRGVVLPRAAQPAVAAGGLILQDRPFAVVWNIPTEDCHRRYNVSLDLGHFDIVENRQQRFHGQEMTIFYRDHLGKYPYLSPDGSRVNGGLPQLSDLSAHLSLAMTQMSGLLQPNFSGLAVIDWEEWWPLWERNFGTKMEYQRQSKLLVRQERPDLSETETTALARRKFEESARRFMEETLKSAVRVHPKGLWGFYGFPACLNKKKKTDKSYTGRCQAGTEDQNDRLSWLWRQSTALYPSVYLPQSLAGSTDAALMVRHRLLEALRVASVWHHGNNTTQAIPVLPYARLAFTHSLTFLDKHQCSLLRDYVHTVLGPFVQSLSSDMKRCSLQLCNGNGRCARQRLTSSPAMTSDSKKTNVLTGSFNGKHFHNNFMCECYPGWTGQECHHGNRQKRK
ncbi:hyaluronidase-3 isoform X2 [Anoplopoma fimbria]|uniref:hyaluronidase-3 isoform X2 n=1 Tax=Anoplopoma fimbria TaxID=229290 RepID=UPI0023ED2E57|nr:hyaluronidase-3 isoform X2 [Anoplopoma fimbria]